MKRIPLILSVVLFVLIFLQPIYSQLKTPPKIEWQRSLGGSDWDLAKSVQQTSDGGYIVAGSTESFDGDVNKTHSYADYWVVKLSPSGLVEWKWLSGGNDFDVATSIREAKDGSYIIAGRGGGDFWVVNLTQNGVLNWERFLGGNLYDEATCILPTLDGGYITTGYSNSNDGDVKDNHGQYDCLVIKLASNGLTEWSRSYGGSATDGGNSIRQTSDSGYIIAGYSESDDGDVTGNHGSKDSTDYWVIKLSKKGSIEWQRSLGGSRVDYAYDLQQTADEGFIVVGYSGSIDGDVNGHHESDDVWVVKLTDNGSIEWDRSLGGTGSDGGFSVYETNDGGYTIAGTTKSHDGNVSFNHGGYDYWLVKLSNSGILEWEKSFGGTKDDYPRSIQQTTDGGFIIAGYSESNDGNLTENHGYSDYWIIKLSPENPSSVESESATTHTTTITPNPATSSATLLLESDKEGMCEVQIISIAGVTHKEYSARLVTGKQEIALTGLEALPTGMYEVVVNRGGQQTLQTKLIIE